MKIRGNDAARLAYSINSFAKCAEMGRTTVYAEIRAGRLKAKRRGSQLIVTAEAARAYLDSLPDADPNNLQRERLNNSPRVQERLLSS